MTVTLYTTEALAELLQVSPRTILRERLAGRLSYKRIRGRIRFSQEDIDKYLRQQDYLFSSTLGQEVASSEKIRIFAGRK
jgi:excisionase family DNA binding protein